MLKKLHWRVLGEIRNIEPPCGNRLVDYSMKKWVGRLIVKTIAYPQSGAR
ncbi:hypothetical protein HanPSC8_Chr15g0689741 [Helianthus annuus]|nr:hypothetical protein HanPSC8_Chr15g0689741 [Helianthus annuus]